ncbi:MAG: redoxin domain-containing protein [Burkholderiales bacterium]|nr:redoxin domain-containing protein [Burkholderiales bacterium]
MVAFQLDLPKFEAANTQVLGISVDFNAANTEFATKLGLKFPLLSDTRRIMSRAYGVLNDNPELAKDPKRIPAYLRAKRAWFIIDREGIVRYANVDDPRGIMPNDELLEVLKKLQ